MANETISSLQNKLQSQSGKHISKYKHIDHGCNDFVLVVLVCKIIFTMHTVMTEENEKKLSQN